jgi:hypothetical protein
MRFHKLTLSIAVAVVIVACRVLLSHAQVADPPSPPTPVPQAGEGSRETPPAEQAGEGSCETPSKQSTEKTGKQSTEETTTQSAEKTGAQSREKTITRSPGAKDEQRFLRLLRDKDGNPVALQAAVVHCVPKDHGKAGPTVDLVAAVHVAEESYYDELNRLFATYDAVLFELVAPEGARVPKGGVRPSGGPVSFLQNAMTDVMELEFQLEGIDYTPENFVHADMSPDEFAESMRRRGESVLQIFFRMMGHAMARQAQDSASGGGDFRLLLAFFDKNRALAVKRVLAEQFQDLEGSLNAIEGPDGSTLISERNKVALGVLRREIAAGKKKLAIFYGAGHMPNFEQRLASDFGLVPASTRWLVAWNLQSEPASKNQRPKPSRETGRSSRTHPQVPEPCESVAP